MTIEKRGGGGGGSHIGDVVYFPSNTPVDYSFNDERWLRSGTIETNTNNYDENIWSGYAGSSVLFKEGTTIAYIRIT